MGYPQKLIHRTLLFTAAHNEKYLKKSFQTKADSIVFDLEDAVPIPFKEKARVIIKEFLESDLPDNRPIYIRINPLDTDLTLLDLEATAHKNISGYVYPTCNSPEDIHTFAAQLSLKERTLNLEKGHFKIIPIIESSEGITKVNEIAKCSNRIIGLIFGSEDFLANQLGFHGKEDRGTDYPRHKVAIAAKANNLIAIDTPYVKVGDFEGLNKHIDKAIDYGYEGMLVMSPREIDIIKNRYTPSEEKIKNATKMIELYDQAVENGKGIVIYNDVFVSPPTLKFAKNTLEHYQNILNYEEYFFNS